MTTATHGTGYVHGRDVPETETATRIAPYAWAVTRVALAWVFLWAFLDKTFGLGYATPAERAWIDGGSPTAGFLKGVEGPFADFFNGLAGNAFVDWLFMLGLLGIGVAFVLGVFMRIAAAAAVVMLGMLYLAVLPIENNPFMDDHVVYALVAIALAASNAGDTLGLGRVFAKTSIVRRFPVLR